MTKKLQNNLIERPPVVVVMGHIDHGKSTLLDYIRKSNVVGSEAGGITQHISAYEVMHKDEAGKEHLITFLDTPGHEAFNNIRARGAKVADVAILVVSAVDGVKTQTLEALKHIKEEKLPFIVAINKIDKPEANVEKTKQGLAENEIYIEGYGGTVPAVALSAKTGEGIPALLDMLILVAELDELKGDPNKNAEGVVIENNLDPQKGTAGSLIIKDGVLKKGMYVVSSDAITPVRIMENFMGKKIEEARFSSPVKIIGWSKLPAVGSLFKSFSTKKDADDHAVKNKPAEIKTEIQETALDQVVLPIVIKADTSGSLEAILHEIEKLKINKVSVNILNSGIGTITENDVRMASGNKRSFIIGFNTKVDSPARNLAERTGIEINVFSIIYKVTEWLENIIKENIPVTEVEEMTSTAKVLKIFSKTKDKQIIGGKIETGSLTAGATIKIKRRDAEIGTGKIRGLEQQKKRVDEVKGGFEFGAMIEAKTEIAPGDKIESFKIVKKQLIE